MDNPGIRRDLPPSDPQRPPAYSANDVSVRREPDSPLGGLIPTGNPKSLVAYYCGVFTLIPCLGLLLGPIALLFGVLGAKYANANPQAKGMVHSVVGIVLGSLTTLANYLAIGVVLVSVLMSKR